MTDELDVPDVLSSDPIHEGWLGLRIDRIRYPSGRETTHDVVVHNGGVTLLPVDANDNVLFVRQYRHAIGRELLELPAGTIDPGEDPLVCAQRELQEEIGYRAANIEALGGFYSAPGYCTEYLWAYLCTGLTESRLTGDEEQIDVVPVPLSDANALLASGQIQDAKTLAAFQLYARQTS